MLTEENKRERMFGVGGSEIAAVAGENPWEGPITIYERKIGIAPEVEDNTDMQRGRFLEGGILEWTAHCRGTKILRNDKLHRNPEYPVCIATPDGFEFVETFARAVAEAKAPRRGDRWRHPDEDRAGFPRYVMAQAQWEMLACQLPAGIVVALIYGEPWIYEVAADQDLQAALLDASLDFWKHVENRDPPDPELPGEASVFGRLVAQKGSDLVAPASVEEAAELARKYRAFKDEEERAKQDAERVKNAMLPLIGEHAGLDLGRDGPRVTYRLARGKKETSWEKVATALSAKVDGDTYRKLVDENTATTKGSRRFLVKLPKEE